jgi:hypothetical protein
MWFMTYRLTVKTLVAEGVFTQEQYEYLLRLFMDPAFRVPSDTLFSAWGRKPVTQNE